jgi:hypothetical protein
VAIFQHSLQFLQSESFQTHVGTIHRRAIGPIAHHNSTSVYSPSLTCHSPAPTIECLHRPPYKLTCFSHCFPDTTSPTDLQTRLFYLSRSPKTIEHVTMEINYCLFKLLYDNEARLSSIVAYLRKRNVVLSHCYNANVIEPREPHTCNNTNFNEKTHS